MRPTLTRTRKDPPGAQAGQYCVRNKVSSGWAIITGLAGLAIPVPRQGTTHFEHNKNTIGRPEAPERSEQLGNWETLGVAAQNVLLAMGRP